MLFKCTECGSKRVQMLDWIDPNTGEVIGGNEDTDDPSHGFCSECGENVRLELK